MKRIKLILVAFSKFEQRIYDNVAPISLRIIPNNKISTFV